MKISGFPKSMVQFIISKPTPKIKKAFGQERSKVGSPSPRVVFHGTPLHNIHSILRTGFILNHGGIWDAEEPSYSYGFAAKRFLAVAGNTSWRHFDPYGHYGALFGCELLAQKPNYPVATHVTKQPSKIIARYLFLLPRADMPGLFHDGGLMVIKANSIRRREQKWKIL
jgi:hypothetical protein